MLGEMIYGKELFPETGIIQPVSYPHESKKLEILAIDYEFKCFGLHFVVKAGFPWDGASIPPVADRVVGHPFEPSNKRFSLGHDALFRAGICSWSESNKWAVEVLKQRPDVGKVRLWMVLKGLQIGSYPAWISHRKRPEEWQKRYIKIL